MNRLDWAIVVLAFACLGLAARITQAPAQLYPIHGESPVILFDSSWQRDDYVVTTWYYLEPSAIIGVYGPYHHDVLEEHADQMKVLLGPSAGPYRWIWLPDLGDAETNRVEWGAAYARFIDARDAGILSGVVPFSSFMRH